MQDLGSTRGKLYQFLCWILSLQIDKMTEENLKPAELPALRELAQKHGVAPLTFEKLKQVEDEPGISPEMHAQLAQLQATLAVDYYKSSAQNQLLYGVLNRINQEFASENISAILLKGAALGLSLYDDYALRPMSDLDLLVRREDLQRASLIIQSFGYQVLPQQYLGIAGWVDRSLNHHAHFRGGTKDGIAIELHWNLVAGDSDWRSPALDRFWNECEHLELPEMAQFEAENHADSRQSRKVRVLSPTTNLLYLAAHLFLQHGSYRSILLWYYDIHLLLTKQREHIQWEVVFETACELRWADAVRLALIAVQDRFNTPIPDGVIKRLESMGDPQAKRIIAINARKLEQRTLDTWQSLEVYDSSTRLRLILALAFPSPTYIRWRYHPTPDWLWPFYYPYRWLDITSDGFATLLGKR